MIVIGLGANLSSAVGPPRATCEAALDSIEAEGIRVVARSRWFESAPVPPSDQPWYINGVARVETDLGPAALLAVLQRVERAYGRARGRRNAARQLDLDLLAYGDRVEGAENGLILPHPRLHERAFVLLPLADIVPEWRHPASGRSLTVMIADLAPGQVARPLA